MAAKMITFVVVWFILLLFFPLLTFQHPLIPFLLSSQRGGGGENEIEPMICTEITFNQTYLNFYQGQDPFPNVTIFAKMMLFKDSKTQDYYIRVSDVEAHDLTHNLTSYNFCYDNINRQCNDNVTAPYNFDLNQFDPLAIFSSSFVKSDPSSTAMYVLGYAVGYVSNGGIKPFDGTLFSVDEPCHLWSLEWDSIKVDQTLCCTKMTPAPKAPRAPRCKRFQSDLIFYNGDNTVFASSSMNYTLNGNQLQTQGNYTFVSGYPYLGYFFNGIKECGSAEDSQLRCNVTLPQGDKDIFIAMAYSEITEHGFYDYLSPLRAAIVGSFILRNDQTLMYEGVPFTPQNACVSYIGHNYLNKPSLCQFCCKEFE